LLEERNMSNQDETFRGRRRFLRQTATAAGGGVLVLLATGEQRAGQAQPGDAVSDAVPASQGYRVTDHIRTYYATLRS
jgi:hypothetical protein